MNDFPEPHETKSLFTSDKRLLFILICLATLLLLFIKKSFIESETAAFEFLEDRPEGTVLRVLNAIQYFSVPLVYTIKFTVIGFVVWVGCFMFGFRVTYGECWRIVMVAEFIFLGAELLKILWLLFFTVDPSYSDVSSFYPLSLIQFVDANSIDPRYAYPLRALNLFEIVYWFLLVKGLTEYTRHDTRKAWIITLGSYVPIFLLWLVFYIIVYK